MTKRGMSVRAMLFAACGALAIAPAVASAQSGGSAATYNIPAQDLGTALTTLARKAGREIYFSSDLTRGKRAPQVKSARNWEDALRKMLGQSGLTYRISANGAVVIEGNGQSAASASSSSVASLGRGEGGTTSSSVGGGAASGSDTEVSGEIVVTAQKREERLQDVPVPVTVVNAQQLTDSNLLRLQDYYTRVPGFSLTMLGDVGAPIVTIRGLTTGGYNNPTVGIVVDDIPFGASTQIGGGATAPDVDPMDLARVEVLRGPQGTLYGASSLGGLVKFVTVDPSTRAVSGTLRAGLTAVKDGDEIGYSVRGALNVPLTDDFAVRVSGFKRRDAGYIDNVQTGRSGINRIDASGIRVAALWMPSDSLSIKLSALVQSNERDGASDVHNLPGLQDNQQSALINTGWYDNNLQAYSATINADLGPLKFTSLTGYSVIDSSLALDGTPSLGGLTMAQFGVGGFSGIGSGDTKKFTQEVRATAPVGSAIEILLGGFYTHEKSSDFQDYRAINPTNGATAGTWLLGGGTATYEEFALFSTITAHFSDRFDVQVGGRKSWQTIGSGTRTDTGPWNTVLVGAPSQTVVRPAETTKDDSFTFLITPRLKITPELMVYGRVASGYRPGGPNFLSAGTTLPRDYGADTSVSYEAGFKGTILNGRLLFDASVYYIDWKDIQVQLRAPPFTIYTVNGGEARSKGAEFSVDYRHDGFSISSWVAWNDAELTFVPTGTNLVARAGDRLPYSSPFSANLSVDKEFSISDRATASVGISYSYVDKRVGRFFANTLPRQVFPSYSQLDLRSSVRFDNWTISAFLTNLLDERGVLRGGRDASLSLPYSFTYTQPRTVGLAITRDF